MLLGALEPKFWRRFCVGIGRSDLIERHDGTEIAFGDDQSNLRAELEREFAKEPSHVWLQRLLDWDVPGGQVYDVPAIMVTAHDAQRAIVSARPASSRWSPLRCVGAYRRYNLARVDFIYRRPARPGRQGGRRFVSVGTSNRKHVHVVVGRRAGSSPQLGMRACRGQQPQWVGSRRSAAPSGPARCGSHKR